MLLKEGPEVRTAYISDFFWQKGDRFLVSLESNQVTDRVLSKSSAA
jgi:hypothetical protein